MNADSRHPRRAFKGPNPVVKLVVGTLSDISDMPSVRAIKEFRAACPDCGRVVPVGGTRKQAKDALHRHRHRPSRLGGCPASSSRAQVGL